MSESQSVQIGQSVLGGSLQQMLMCADIEPGDPPSYQLCKTIYSFHPLGKKMADTPVMMALAMGRHVVVQTDTPDKRVANAFKAEWKRLGCTRLVANVGRLSRVYGLASLICGSRKTDPSAPIDLWKLAEQDVYFSVFDPLNTSGSLTLSQDPNSPDFQAKADLIVQGKTYHRSRTVTLMHEEPIYIEWSPSAFGFVGRSVYQRALFPMKTFIQSMQTDDMVTKKAGVLIAKLTSAGPVINRVMQGIAGIKRAIIQVAMTGNVISIGKDDAIETLNMQNVDEPAKMARSNCLENCALAADMPAKILNSETFAEGFGEGTEDAKNIAGYVNSIREWLDPACEFLDPIVMHRAWNEDFVKTLQADFPEQYGGKDYKTLFYEWKNAFLPAWPSLLTEPDSEKVKVEDVAFRAVVALAESLLPELDPENKAKLIDWIQGNINEATLLFAHKLDLDIPTLLDFLMTKQEQADTLAEAAANPDPPDAEGETEPHAPAPFSRAA